MHSTKRLVVGAVTLAASLFGREALAGPACRSTTFDTEFVKAACLRGGQQEAKKAMKEWVKQVRRSAEAAQATATRSQPAEKGESKAHASTEQTHGPDRAAAAAKSKVRDARTQAAAAVDAQRLDCKACHAHVGGDYARKPEALELYRELDGD